MFCPKCGQQNPEEGKFCRSCGTDLGNVSHALTSPAVQQPTVLNHKGKPISYESAFGKIFTGIAFLAVAIAMSFTVGKGWWFWMLIPAFGSLGAGIAQYIQIKNAQGRTGSISPIRTAQPFQPRAGNEQLPAGQTEWVPSDAGYKTGDLVPPSVAEGTTRHLELDSEGQTMTLPKK